MKRLATAAFFLIVLVAMGCAAGVGPVSSQAVPEAVSLVAGLDCGGVAEEAVATWISDEAQYQVVLQKIMARRPGGAMAGLAPVDFSSQGVLCIAMGYKPTAGFSLGLAGGAVTVDGNTATVRITWNEPPPGAIVPQMLTSPCLLVRLPRAGFSRVKVVDQSGRQRMMLAIE